MDQTGVKIPVGVGQRTVFLERRRGREGEGLLKARPHTNVRYSNEQSGPSEYHSQWRHPAKCDIVKVYQFLCTKCFVAFSFDKGVSDENIREARYDVSDVLLLHLCFTA